MIETKYKIEFPDYDKYESPVKSLINFMMKHGAIWQTGVAITKAKYEKTDYIITDVYSKKLNKYVFQLPEQEHKIAIVNGSMSNNCGYKHIINNAVVFINDDSRITIITDRNDLVKYNITVTPVPALTWLTSILRLEEFSHISGYDICAVLNSDKAIETGVKYPSAYCAPHTEGFYVVQPRDGNKQPEEYNNYRLVMTRVPNEKGDSDRQIYIKMEVFDGETRIAHTSDAGFAIQRRDEPCYNNMFGFSVSVINRKKLYPDAGGSTQEMWINFIRFLTFNGTYGIALIDDSILDENNSIEFKLSGGSNSTVLQLMDSGMLTYNMSNKELEIIKNINTKLSLYKARPATPNSVDRTSLEEDNNFIEIPMNVSIENSDDVTDEMLVPYISVYSEDAQKLNIMAKRLFSNSKLQISDGNVNNIAYQLKTSTFTITDSYKEGDADKKDIYNCYYKLGIVANDGIEKSSLALSDEFKDSCFFTFCNEFNYEWKDIYTEEGLSIFNSNPAIKPKDTNAETFYSVSDILIRLDKISEIKIRERSNATYNTSTENGNEPGVTCLSPAVAILPIIEVNTASSEHLLRGMMYMQLFNADTDQPIEKSFIVTRKHHNMKVSYDLSGEQTDAVLADLEITPITEA